MMGAKIAEDCPVTVCGDRDYQSCGAEFLLRDFAVTVVVWSSIVDVMFRNAIVGAS